MTLVGQQSNNLRSIAEQVKTHAEQTRSTFTDESRPQFDHRVIEAMRMELRSLSTQVSELGAELEYSLRLLSYPEVLAEPARER